MDFSPWDLSPSFRLHEAACLMAGVPPLSKRVPSREELPAQAVPYYVELGKAYFIGAYVFDRPDDERFQRETLLTGNSTDESGKPDIPHSIDELTGELVSRAELHRWITATGIKSAYSFAPIGSKLSADAIQPTAAPMLKQSAQEQRILELIEGASHDALKLPISEPGKKGIKSNIKAKALALPSLFTANSFDKAWQRLRDDGRLAGD